MKIINAVQVNACLNYPALIAQLNRGLAMPFKMPRRQVFELSPGTPINDAFALLPSWNQDYMAVKAFTYFPQNAAQNLCGLHSQILLFSRKTGENLACIDGSSLTHWRTAAVSALAARYLSNPDSRTLLLLGTGNLAAHLVHAHASVRPLDKVIIWGRNEHKAAQLAHQLNREFEQIAVCSQLDIEQAAQDADIIVAATGSPTPLLYGDWVLAGTHVDLLGNHSPDRRECDTRLMVRARCYADSLDNVKHEAGEYLIPLQEKAISPNHFIGELAQLANGSCTARESLQEITLFKSVGMAIADLLAASWVYERLAK